MTGDLPDKAVLRKRAQSLRDEAALQTPDAGMALAAHAPRLSAGCVAAYRPIRNEIDPLPLARRVDAPTMALPVVSQNRMAFHLWREGERLVPGAFGIDEPTGRVVLPDLLLVPLLAFTRQGGRLGYGAGHYDRYIAAHQGVRTIGIAFAAQELPNLPLEDHDETLAAIATEREWIAISEDLCVSSS